MYPGISKSGLMEKSAFKSTATGRLVAATAWERRLREGIPESTPVQGWAFVPDSLPPKVEHDLFIGRVSTSLLSAQANLARLDGIVAGLPDPGILLYPFGVREAKLSSKIENTIASAEELAIFEANRSKARDEVREVRNYMDALEHGLKSKLPLGNRLFREMHEILMAGVRGQDKRPGEFRSTQVFIGDESKGFRSARFVPPPPGNELQQCLADFERFLNPAGYGQSIAGARLPRLVEIAVAHYQFECIHPFSDGNGRLGRSIVAVSLCKEGLLSRPLTYVSAFFEKRRQDYYDLLLRVSTHGDWEAWVKFFCDAVATEALDGIRRARRLHDLRERYVKAVTAKRGSVLAARLVDWLFVRPAVTASSVARRLEVSIPSAQKHIDRLVRARILREITGGTYGRVYLARGITRAIEAEEEEEATVKTELA